MARSMGFPVNRLRCVGVASLVGGVFLALGAAPSLAQVTSTSSVTFNYLNDADNPGPNTTSINTASSTDRRNGTITYNGSGALTNPLGPGFEDITGIQFVNPFTFDYSGQAGSSTASITNFSSFFFLGTCPICLGQTLEEAVTIPDSQGNILTTSISGVGTIVTVGSGPVPIRFGSNGSPGTISFSAQNFVAINNTIGSGTGFISFDMIPDTTGVPGPLPILGASTAFAFSRRLRRRVSIARAVD